MKKTRSWFLCFCFHLLKMIRQVNKKEEKKKSNNNKNFCSSREYCNIFCAYHYKSSDMKKENESLFKLVNSLENISNMEFGINENKTEVCIFTNCSRLPIKIIQINKQMGRSRQFCQMMHFKQFLCSIFNCIT